MNGSSNSRSTDEKRPRWDRAGLDTVSAIWGDEGGSELLSALAAAPTIPYARGQLLTDRTPSGMRVMSWPEMGVVKVEGRLAAAIDKSHQSHRLAERDELRQIGDVMSDELEELLGCRPSTRAVGVGRYDLVTERDFQDGNDGRQLLRAMRALCPPRCKLKVHSTPMGVETVTVLSGRRSIFRAYDKGLESGTAAPGERIRFEAQVQRAKAARQGPNATAESDLRAAFGRTIEPFMQGAPVTVTTASGVVDQVAEKLSTGELSVAKAERLVGAAELLRRYGRGIYVDDWRSARRLRDLRDVGIAIDDQLPEGTTVPVSELLQAALEEWST